MSFACLEIMPFNLMLWNQLMPKSIACFACKDGGDFIFFSWFLGAASLTEVLAYPCDVWDSLCGWSKEKKVPNSQNQLSGNWEKNSI